MERVIAIGVSAMILAYGYYSYQLGKKIGKEEVSLSRER